MSSSDEALRFFNEWLNSKTKLEVTFSSAAAVVSLTASIASIDETGLRLVALGCDCSVFVPLSGCTFSRADPERDKSDLPGLDELSREMGFSFGWSIKSPYGGETILLYYEK